MRLAREARDVSGRDVLIAGAIGPLGELEVFDAGEHGPLYAEQARVLEGRGVDLFMIETFFDLDELVAAVEAVRGVSSLPIVALLTFDDEAETGGGVDAARRGRRLAELDVAAIGTNHGAGPHAALLALDAMRDSGVPLAALPNIGLASIVGGRVVYPHSTPEYFATSPPRRPRSARASSAAAAARRRRRSRRSGRRSTTSARRGPRSRHASSADGRLAVAGRRRDAARPRAARGRVGRQRRARPAEGRHERRR